MTNAHKGGLSACQDISAKLLTPDPSPIKPLTLPLPSHSQGWAQQLQQLQRHRLQRPAPRQPAAWRPGQGVLAMHVQKH